MSENLPISVSWEVNVPVLSQPDETLHLTRPELSRIIQQTTVLCVEGISRAFKLDKETTEAIWERASRLDVTLVSGKNYGEYPQNNPDRFYVGPAALALVQTVETVPVEAKNNEVCLSIDGIADEMAILTSASRALRAVVNDSPNVIREDSIAKLDELSDSNQLMNMAVSLAFARRLIKYGLLPDESMTKVMKETYGFEDWVEHSRTMIIKKEKSFTKKERLILEKMYRTENQAPKNLRHTVWAELFYDIVGIDPRDEQFFYMFYYTPAMGDKKNHTISFNNGPTCNVNKSETSQCLTAIFNPKSVKPKLV